MFAFHSSFCSVVAALLTSAQKCNLAFSLIRDSRFFRHVSINDNHIKVTDRDFYRYSSTRLMYLSLLLISSCFHRCVKQDRAISMSGRGYLRGLDGLATGRKSDGDM